MTGAARQDVPGTWCLRYASHLGYRPPSVPLFPHSAAGAGPLEQIDFAVSQGFAGMQYVLACESDVAQQAAVAARLQQHGLATGCMLYAPFKVIREPYLGRSDTRSREMFLDHIQAALEVARRINSRQIAVLAAADPDIPHAEQVQALVENLRYAADLVQRAGVTLELEGVSSPMLPPMIVHRLDDIIQVIDRVSSPNVRLIYDTGHVQAIEGDAAAHLGRVYDYIDIVQLADQPGRLEPGSGTIDFESILTQIARRGFSGLVELEHSWKAPGLEAERAGLESLRKLDARVREHLRHVD
jgi:hydroxypyruvate isomerase